MEVLETLITYLPTLVKIAIITGIATMLGYILAIASVYISVVMEDSVAMHIITSILSTIIAVLSGICGTVFKITFSTSILLFIIKIIIGA